MPLMTWNKNLEVGVRSMDQQHRKLVDLINALHEAMLEGKANEILGPVLEDLLRYTATHFKDEEALMTRAGYAGRDPHVAEHRALIAEVRKMQDGVRSGKLAISVSVAQFLRDWLQNHILKTDQQYSSAMIAKGIQ